MVRAFGARGDGIHDDTAALQAALDHAAAAGAGVVVLPPGVYRVRTALVFRGDGCELIGDGQPTIEAAGLITRVLDSDHRSRLRIAGLRIQGVGAQAQRGRGAIHLDSGSTGCTVENNEIRDAPGAGIVDDGDDNTLRGNLIDRTGEHGIYVSGCHSGTYAGNRIRGAGSVPGSTLTAHGISVADATDCVVQANHVTGGGVGLALRDGTRRILVSGNVVHDTGDRPMLIGSASDSRIAGNELAGTPAGEDTLQVSGGGGNRIEGNYLHHATPGGAALRWTGRAVRGDDLVRGNTVLLEGPAVNYWGLEIDAAIARPIRIEGNTIQAIHGAAPPAAIRIHGGRGHAVLGNLILGAAGVSDLGLETRIEPRQAQDRATLGPGFHRLGLDDGGAVCDARDGPVTIVLPRAAGIRWRVYAVERTGPALFPIVVRGSGPDLIDGRDVARLVDLPLAIHLQSTGTGWRLLTPSGPH
jgi:parallel beta-helix repeat protein